MGAVVVHEFMSLDGVIDAPTWTFEYGFDPKMGEAIAAVTAKCRGILLGRTTYEMFEPAWSKRTAEDDPGAPFFNDTMKYVVSGTPPRGVGDGPTPVPLPPRPGGGPAALGGRPPAGEAVARGLRGVRERRG